MSAARSTFLFRRFRSSLWAVCAVLSLGGVPRAGTVPVQGELVTGREYVDVLRREIKNARRSIHACLYLFSLPLNQTQSQPMLLAEALVDARRRGLRVDVLLDGTRDFGGGYEEGSPRRGRNRTAYDYLSARGVDVFFTTSPATVHTKAVVFDETSVLLGSTNWSESAFSRNLEANALVRSPALAREMLEDFQKAGRARLSEDEESAVPLPLAFLTSPDRLGVMARRADQRAFDVYLYLCSVADGRDSFELSYAPLAASLGIDAMEPLSYRRQITKTLKKLETAYGLIRADFNFGGDASVTLVPLPGDILDVPLGYWSDGWCRELRFPGKVMFLLNRYYSERSTRRPSWTAAVKTLARRHGLSQGFVTQGTTELRRAGLVAVDYDEVGLTGSSARRPNIYTPRPLYDPRQLSREWQELEEKHGADALARARKCAALVYADADVDAVRKFLQREKDFGGEKVRRAYRLIAKKSPDNPRRSVGYFLALIERMD